MRLGTLLLALYLLLTGVLILIPMNDSRILDVIRAFVAIVAGFVIAFESRTRSTP